MTTEKYYLKADHQTEWSNVTREQFIAAEQAAGFRSKFGSNHPATGGFTGGGMRGRVEYVTEQPRPEQVGGECAEDCHFGDHDDYDIEQERIKFQKELGAAMVKAGAREVELDALAAPERGERNDKMYSKSSRQTGQHVHFCMFCGQSGTELSNKQHSTLIEQRERLLDLVKQLPLAKEAEGLVERIDSVLTTIEQEGTQGR